MLYSFFQATTSQTGALEKLGSPNLFASLGLDAPSWGLFIGIAFGVATLLFGFVLRRGSLVIFLLSNYIALVLIHTFPLEVLGSSLQEKDEGLVIFAYMRAGIFIFTVFLLFFLLSRSIAKSLLRKKGQMLTDLLLSVLGTGLFLSAGLTFAFSAKEDFLNEILGLIFVSKYAVFGWVLTSVLFMAILRKPKKKMSKIPSASGKSNEEADPAVEGE
jgi:uncharacterized protein YhhL (DUF1145 family)